MTRSVEWKPGEPCPFCGNEHDGLRVEGGPSHEVAICPPSEQDRIRAEIARSLWPGLQEAVRLEPSSSTIRERIAAAERGIERGREIVTDFDEVASRQDGS